MDRPQLTRLPGDERLPPNYDAGSYFMPSIARIGNDAKTATDAKAVKWNSGFMTRTKRKAETNTQRSGSLAGIRMSVVEGQQGAQQVLL